MTTKTCVPNEYANEFINLVKKMETETGTFYELSIKQFGTFTNDDLILCDFNKRQKYVIFDMGDDYKELEGSYETIEQVYDKLTLLTYPIFESIKINEKLFKVWKCPKCGKLGTVKSPNIICNELCQNCGYRYSSQWHGISIGIHEGNIYTGGGSLCTLTEIGKIKFS